MQQHKLCINIKIIVFIWVINILNFLGQFFLGINCTLFFISIELEVSLGDYAL